LPVLRYHSFRKTTDDDEYGEDGDIPDEPFDFFHATTNQKNAGVTEGGWDRPHDRAKTLGEWDGK
jgi:hypothetical protein